MSKLILIRHLQSQWNKENRFTGWTDVPLSQEGEASAKKAAEKLSGFKIDKVYTSPLFRNKTTAELILKELNLDRPVIINEALNERHYGQLQGLNKDEVKEEYGQEQVQNWRRGWAETPPGGESLKDVYGRVVPLYEEEIKKDLEKGENVLVVASHNSLRALVKHLENIPDDEISQVEIEPAGVKEYDF
jgi:2,3-bisphosphoglycerate-dependent phosphoglycerate mutase